jgi:cytochrome c peroxidase
LRGHSTVEIFVALAMAALVCACQAGPSRARLDADNPIRPIAPPPFGMEEFFKEAPREPEPDRVRLGRRLFFDERLSADNSVACASCHRPEFAFSERSPTRGARAESSRCD